MRCVRLSLGCLLVAVFCMGQAGGRGCQAPIDSTLPSSPLEGLWTLMRGKINVKIRWTVVGGGETQGELDGGILEPLDPADYPVDLSPLIVQWNTGIDDLNAKLDEAFPDSVVMIFPQYGVMKLFNPDDPTKNGTGAINSANEYFFLGDLGGADGTDDQGAGAVLDAATIQGSFDVGTLTTEGRLARTLVVVLSDGGQSGLSFIAEVSIDYTGQWSGEIPPNVAEAIAAQQAIGG